MAMYWGKGTMALHETGPASGTLKEVGMRVLAILTAGLVSMYMSVAQAGSLSHVAGVHTTPSSPLTNKSPNLAFNGLTVDHADYGTGHMMGSSIKVRYFAVPMQNSAKGRAESTCNLPHPFPVQLQIKNVGQANYVPQGPGESVTLQIGTWNAVLPLVALAVGQMHTYSFMPSLGSGSYVLQAHINLPSTIAPPSGPQVHDVSWPLNIICDNTSAVSPSINTGIKPGKIRGVIWWDDKVMPRNPAALSKGPNGLFNGCAGLTVMLGHPTAFGPHLGNLQYLRYVKRGNISECQFEFTQVPVNTELAVGYTINPVLFEVPVSTTGQSHSFTIPGNGNMTYYLRVALMMNIHPKLMSP